MKIIATALFCLALAACGQQAKEGENTKIEGTKPPAEKGAAIKYDAATFATNIDPVCEMDISSGVNDTAVYGGKVYGFCGAGCKEEFVKNPAAFVKK